MDDLAKKLFVQLGDASKAVRDKALDALVKRLPDAARFFPDAMLKIEQGERYAALEVDYHRVLQDNARLVQEKAHDQNEIARLSRELANYKALVWGWVNKTRLGVLAGCAMIPFIAWFGFEYAARVDAANSKYPVTTADNLAANWPNLPGWPANVSTPPEDKPFVMNIGSEEWWVLIHIVYDLSHYADKSGNPAPMRCVHVYGVPVKYGASQILRDDAYDVLGQIRWPERSMICSPPRVPIAGLPNNKEASR
jgi:hypothetical protein